MVRMWFLALLGVAGMLGAEPLSNGSFERMGQGAPVGWEKYDDIGAGTLAQDTSTYHAGSASMRVSQVLGIYGIGSEKLPFYPWQKSLTVKVWVKGNVAGKFAIWVIWYKKDNVVKSARTSVASGTYDWLQATLTDSQPPAGAGRYQVFLVSETSLGSVWMDDASVTIGMNPKTDILVNQIGYRKGWPKRFVVQSSAPLSAGAFQILAADGSVAYSGRTIAFATPQGWPFYYLRGDFTSLDTDGTYRVRVPSSGLTSYSFRIADRPYEQAEDLARQFFYYQRCGAKIPGWHTYCHYDDGSLGGAHYPTIGGWHEAGDYVKTTVGQPLGLFALSRLASKRSGSGTYGKITDECKWGATFMTQFVNPSTRRILAGVFPRKFFWGPPEDETDGLPDGKDDREIRDGPIGNTDNQLAAAGFGILSQVLARQDYLAEAEDLWNRIAGQIPEDPPSLGRMIILDTVLFERTGDKRYSEQAHRDIDALIALQQSDGGFQRYNFTDRGMPVAGLALWAETFPQDSYKPRIKAALKKFLKNVNSMNRNPFGIQQYDSSDFFFPYDTIDAFHVGENSDYISVAWAAAAAGKVVGLSPSTKRIIQNHIDWIMGKNPFGVCMVEGSGSYNAPMYHHRFDTLPGHSDGAVPGAIPNGLTRESIDSAAPRFDVLGNSFETNEPWVPHNSYFLLLMAELFS